MPFKHPCFISYVRGEHELIKGFLDQFSSMLRAYLEPYPFEHGPYIDRELPPGVRFEEHLADAICRSVCMIVVYFPKYAYHDYCMREYRAMEILEERRLALLGKEAESRGLIIPIVLRGRKEDLPTKIRDRIHFCDFSKFTTATVDIGKDQEYVDKIDKIAAYIDELRKDFEKLNHDVCADCSTFRLPPMAEVVSWQEPPVGPTSPFVLRGRKE